MVMAKNTSLPSVALPNLMISSQSELIGVVPLTPSPISLPKLTRVADETLGSLQSSKRLKDPPVSVCVTYLTP